ncbi:uncharacterized mitochondrial protein AtMg00810-like [Cannabis sativa]|uniref:uncharacterized mitochondrial protein AtMg00810-like n=1 Tax=Cannabis sativa TaxID=3483 RepID=UPI0029CA937D|nr:uncharacterized mitochondrial protein AtMg00810-like [Cannabis sativa]
MTLPSSTTTYTQLVCKLHKSIYGLKQSSRKWYRKLSNALLQDGFHQSQANYTLLTKEDTGYTSSKPAKTLIDPRIQLDDEQGEPPDDPSPHRQLIGQLLYLTLSRSDITYVVHNLSQFMLKPRTPHLQAVHHLIRYLKGSPGQGLLYSTSSSLHLCGFSYFDWASCPTTRRSTIGFCVFFGDCLVSWRTKKQRKISKNSTEAEYHALAASSSELTWLQYLLTDFQIQ